MLTTIKYRIRAISIIAASVLSLSSMGSAFAAEEAAVAFPDKWMIRVGAYFVDDANTTVSFNTGVAGLGTMIDYQKTLGGEDGNTIPRIDFYYRFNPRHRIDFTAFSLDRKGERILDQTIEIDGTTYNINESIKSDLQYAVYKLGYSYSFYHSSKTELSLSAGLNITSYDFKIDSSSTGSAESAGVTVPLPVIGLRLGYAITPKWYVRYVSEAFFVDIEDKFRGGLINYEINTEYKIFDNFALGAGIARLAVNAEIDDEDWRGTVSDGFRGLQLFGTVYF